MKLVYKILIPLIIVIAGYGLMMLLLNMKQDQPVVEHRIKPLKIQAVEVKLADIKSEISAFGNVVSAQPINLNSEVSGNLLESDIPFKPAQSFAKGDLIVKIDDRRAKLRLNSAISEFLSALAGTLPEIKTDFPDEYSVWQNYFNNCNFDSKLPQLPKVNKQKIKLYLSRNNVYKLYFNIRNLEIDLEKHYFYAPFNGFIVKTDLTIGSNARVGSVLGTILSMDELEVEIPIPAMDAQWIDYDQSVNFHSVELNENWQGKIVRIGRAIDQRTQTLPVYAAISKNKSVSIPEGLFLESNIPGLVIENAIRVSLKAVYDDRYVYIIKEGRLEERNITIARKEINSVIITEGLVDGDILVTEVLKGVAKGMPAEARLITPKEILD